MDIERWIQQAKHGDATAFNRLVEHFQATVFHVAYYHVGNTEDALDASQDAMLSAWRHIRRFEGGPTQLRAWLITIVVNVCRDRGRYARRRPQTPIEVDQDGEVRAVPLPDPGESPEAYTERADLRALLERALAELPEDLRTILLLQQLGFGYPELAEALDIPVGTVKSRLSRARAQMRALLAGTDVAADPMEPSTSTERSGSGADAHDARDAPRTLRPGEEAALDPP